MRTVAGRVGTEPTFPRGATAGRLASRPAVSPATKALPDQGATLPTSAPDRERIGAWLVEADGSVSRVYIEAAGGKVKTVWNKIDRDGAGMWRRETFVPTPVGQWRSRQVEVIVADAVPAEAKHGGPEGVALRKRNLIGGAAAGTIAGALVAGPVGALVGYFAGLWGGSKLPTKAQTTAAK